MMASDGFRMCLFVCCTISVKWARQEGGDVT